MKSKGFRIAVAIVLCLLIGTIGSIAVQSSIDTWYTRLQKPLWTPPSSIFAPVWISLYICMGIAAGLVWHKGFYHKWVKTALYHFGLQLALNAVWPMLFFGLRRPDMALIVIISLFITLLFTVKWFKVVSNMAAYLLVPYVLWVAYATALNFSIWQLN